MLYVLLWLFVMDYVSRVLWCVFYVLFFVCDVVCVVMLSVDVLLCVLLGGMMVVGECGVVLDVEDDVILIVICILIIFGLNKCLGRRRARRRERRRRMFGMFGMCDWNGLD